MSHDQSNTNPYRKVSVATWSDRKVMNLSPLQPSGQALFLMLMVGPQTTNIPGIQPVGRMAFAEMLVWDLEAFDQAFAEAYREGLVKADWKARLIFVPNAIKHNLPQSPNVVKSWAPMWSRVPDCPLKTEAWNVLHDALCALGEGFANAFKSACPLKISDSEQKAVEHTGKATGKASPKPSGKPTDNQEAVNSKQEVNTPQPPKGGGRGSRKKSSADLPDGFAEFWAEYPRKDSKVDAVKAWVQVGLHEDLAEREKAMAGLARWKLHEQWTKDNGQFIPMPGPFLRKERWNDGTVSAASAAPVLAPDDPLRAQIAALPADWWRIAGFDSKWDAEASRCNWMNYTEFRNRERVAPAEGAPA